MKSRPLMAALALGLACSGAAIAVSGSSAATTPQAVSPSGSFALSGADAAAYQLPADVKALHSLKLPRRAHADPLPAVRRRRSRRRCPGDRHPLGVRRRADGDRRPCRRPACRQRQGAHRRDRARCRPGQDRRPRPLVLGVPDRPAHRPGVLRGPVDPRRPAPGALGRRAERPDRQGLRRTCPRHGHRRQGRHQDGRLDAEHHDGSLRARLGRRSQEDLRQPEPNRAPRS